jgi:ectoine hydroxylase-related dioxygenase (phytanoyl-CoA dioxygenase family)
MQIEKDRFQQEGYLILDVLSRNQLGALRQAADALFSREPFASSERHHHIAILLPELEARDMHAAIHLPAVLEVIEALLGPDLLLDNAAMLAANPGAIYRQGWHRDVLQIPQDQIDERMFSDAWFHNNVQLNLALEEDSCFWAVPGSHNRPNSEAEQHAFGGSRHRSPVEAQMPDGKAIHVKPGQAVFYNNNLIHRGFADPVPIPRRTLHLGYHTATHAPTWHFYALAYEKLPDDYLASLEPQVRQMIEAHIAVRKAYPDVTETYRMPTW